MFPLTALLRAAIGAVLETLALCLIGYVLARKGILDKKAQGAFNQVNQVLFTPALLFSKIAFTLSPAKLKELHVIPQGFLVVMLVSMAGAFALSRSTGLDKAQTAFTMACAGFQNANALPVALVQAVVRFRGDEFKWTSEDDQESMLARALSYLVLYSVLGQIARWSIGVKLLGMTNESPPRLPNAETAPRRSFWYSVKSLMTMPLLAALLSLMVACMPFVQRILVRSSIVQATLQSAGGCSIPLTLLILGAYFHDEDEAEGSVDSQTIWMAVLSRHVVAPILILPLFFLSAVQDHELVSDPIFVLCACLVIGAPPAIGLAQISAQEGSERLHRWLGKTMLVSYVLLTPVTSIILVLLSVYIGQATSA